MFSFQIYIAYNVLRKVFIQGHNTVKLYVNTFLISVLKKHCYLIWIIKSKQFMLKINHSIFVWAVPSLHVWSMA